MHVNHDDAVILKMVVFQAIKIFLQYTSKNLKKCLYFKMLLELQFRLIKMSLLDNIKRMILYIFMFVVIW